MGRFVVSGVAQSENSEVTQCRRTHGSWFVACRGILLAQAQAGPKRPAQPPVPTRLNTSEQVPERAAAAEAQEQLTALRVENAALRAERDILREDVEYLRGVVVGFLPPARMSNPPEQQASDPPKLRWWRLWRMRGER